MNTAYPLFPVTIITILAYFTTRIFATWGIFSLRWHRKFWNYILLIAFLVSGLLGLLSVIKINYKFEIPGYEKYMQWHVAFGIALVIIAIFHFSWHLKYYFSFRKKKESSLPVEEGMAGGNGLSVSIFLFLLGMTAIINQVVFIREFISVLSGNELVTGIIMAAWMLLTGWGAFYARKANYKGLSLKRSTGMLAAIALLPIILVALLYILKDLMYPPGTLVSIGITVLASVILLFPVCFLSGYLFTAFSARYSEITSSNQVGRTYAIESLGSLAGGLLFSILLGRIFNTFQVFGITAAIILLSGAWISRANGRGLCWEMIIPGVTIPLLIFIFNPDKLIRQISYPNQDLITSQSTRYGNLVVTEQAGQVNVYENNVLQFYTDNLMVSEEAVHFAMIQHENPRQVLLISGGLAGMIGEILKYDVENISYLESNPEMFRSLKELTAKLPGGDKVEIIKKDIRNFTGRTNRVYDVILVNLPAPSSLGLNRFYTDEFFHLLKKHCNPETVIMTSLPSTLNYAEENALNAQASLWKTIGSSFAKRLLITGEKNYFLASDSPLFPDVTQRIMEKGISTEYANSYYLDDRLLAMRSEDLTSQFSDKVPVNRDFYPYMFVKQISYWLSQFGTPYRLMIIVPVIIFLFLFTRTNRITAGLYTGGFTAASLEVTLLLAYQVYFGSIYLSTALFFAIFMAGLAFGSSAGSGPAPQRLSRYFRLQFALAVFALLIPFLLKIPGEMTSMQIPARILVFAMVFILASAIGYEFLLASELRQKNYTEISGINYSTDLAGSAFGAFLTAIVLLPLAGLFYTCLLVAILNIISGLLAYSTRK